MKPQPRVGKKTKKTYDWMNAAWKPVQKASPVDPQAQTNPKRKTATQPERTMPVVTDDQPLTKAGEKKAKQLEARARIAAKKRDFQDALDESSGKAVVKKWKSDFKSKTTSCNLSCVKVQSPTASPSLSPTHTPPPLVKKPRKKTPPKNLDLQRGGVEGGPLIHPINLRNSQAGPYKCELINPNTGKPCSKIITRPDDVPRHEDSIHNAEKQKVRCHLCTEEKTFSRNDGLTKHMRVEHPDVDWLGKTRRKKECAQTKNSNAGLHRKPTNFLSNPTTTSESTMTPESKTVTSLSELGAALEPKLCSLSRSSTILRSALLSPSEIDRPVGLIYGELLRPRRSPRLSPRAQAEAFLEKLGRQLARGDETVWTLTSPKDVSGRATGAESPDPDELHEFERVMMESPSPITVKDKRAPAPAIHNGGGNGLAESSESEEE